VSQVVGGGVLAQPGDRGGDRRACVRAAVGGGQAGAGQVALGALHRGQVPGLVAVEQGEHVVGGGGVGEVVRGAGGQRPRPAQVLVTDAQTRRSG